MADIASRADVTRRDATRRDERGLQTRHLWAQPEIRHRHRLVNLHKGTQLAEDDAPRATLGRGAPHTSKALEEPLQLCEE